MRSLVVLVIAMFLLVLPFATAGHAVATSAAYRPFCVSGRVGTTPASQVDVRTLTDFSVSICV